MKQHIYKDEEKDEVVIEMRVPLMTTRNNPWDEDYHPPMPNILGHIAGDEMGFAYWIDMDYKGKGDQVSMLWWIWNGEKEEFIKLCKELGIEVVEEDRCVKCGKVLYGAHGWDNGPVCESCSK